MQVIAINLEDWEATVSKVAVPEKSLLAILNARLTAEVPWVQCEVLSLRLVSGESSNWAVAKFRIDRSDVTGLTGRARRFDALARIVKDAHAGYEVLWPTAQLH